MSYLNVKRICRLCCKQNSRMRSLYEQQQEHPLPVRQMIYAVAQLEVDPNDGMPQKICVTCTKTLIRIYETVEIFRTNDLKLRKQLTRTMHFEIKDILEVDNVCVKQEVLEEEYHESSQQNEQIETVDDKADYKWTPVGQNIDEAEVIPPMVVSDVRSQLVETVVKIENIAGDDNMVEDTGEDGNNADDDEWRSEAQDSTEEQKQPLRKTKPKRPRYATKYENMYQPHLHDFKCYICKSESHGSTEALVQHMSAHMDILPFTCSECTMEKVVFKGALRVNAHLREHLKPEKCPHCDRRYDSKYKVALHVQKQHAPVADYIQRPSKCKYCVQEYPSKVALLQHMKQVHSAEAASCAFCGEIFKERYLLRLHIAKSHEPDKKFVCDICNREFAALKNLQNHTKTFHSNETFECSYCSKKFRMEIRLRAHEKRHMENPNYVPMKDWSEYYTVLQGEESKPGDLRKKRCNICGVVGAKWLTGHIQNVHFPRKYDCDVCGWSTKNRENYRTHMRVHEQGKTEQCPICERRFPDRRQLIVHLRAKMHRGHPLAESLDWLGDKRQKQSDGDSGSDVREKA
ncbi:zinc finger protein 37-like [Ochlerotatus camptorhynchus]|uniref:zinc finger protein 37-like n=1 Tax=Ochlerotatus camptorhynchus TaxID=644619 RepID=UPI0031DBE057